MSKLRLTGSTSGYSEIAAPAVAGDQVFTLPGTGGVIRAQGTTLTLDTAQASTSGTAINFTIIPSWAKRVTVMFSGVSIAASGVIIVQLGDSDGIENTGYSAASNEFTNNGVGADFSTAGFPIRVSSSTYTYSGQLIVSNLGGNTWVASGVFANTATIYTITSAGAKTLSGTLDRLRVTTALGSTAFDAGSINIMYEG